MNQKESTLWDYSNKSKWLDFREARAFVRNLNLKGIDQWKEYVTGDKENLPDLPGDIPAEPEREYKHLGWSSWEDWLGIAKQRQSKRDSTLWDAKLKEKWLPFENAREFARSLDLEYQEDWEAYIEGVIKRVSSLPNNIPSEPSEVYRHNGWKDWTDWLIPPEKKIEFVHYEKAKRFVWCLRLSSKNDWFEYMRNENAIRTKYGLSIPKRPNLEYRNDGWMDWNDWLGLNHEFVPYKAAKKHIHSLKLRSVRDWRDYCNGNHHKHQKRSEKIPCYPDIAFKETGWNGWEEWLGKSGDSDKIDLTELPVGTIECKCRGMIKDCLECDGKGYVTIKNP